MYEKCALRKKSIKLKNQVKNFFVENCIKFHENDRAIKPKLNRFELNYVAIIPMTLRGRT